MARKGLIEVALTACVLALSAAVVNQKLGLDQARKEQQATAAELERFQVADHLGGQLLAHHQIELLNARIGQRLKR